MFKNHAALLIIENDTIDIMLFKRALADMGYQLPVEYSSDGVKALSFLQDPDNLTPWLIFLDLNIPKINGLEFLSRIKQIERLKWIPVVVISSSENPDDILACMKTGACGYLLKDFEYSAFKESVSLAVRYWARNRTPTRTTIMPYDG